MLVARQRRVASESHDLIAEILLGSAGRELPAAVTQQLDLLAAAKGRRFERQLLDVSAPRYDEARLVGEHDELRAVARP